MRKFDHYEFTGILVPGVAIGIGAAIAFPALLTAGSIKDLSVGGFGILFIVSYVIGHLVQAIGNFLEKIWWKVFGGMPTDWIRTNPGHFMTPEQNLLLQQKISERLQVSSSGLDTLSSEQWATIRRQIYAEVSAAGRATRIDIFNGNYGLNRGLTVALLLTGAVLLITSPARYELVIAAFAASVLAAYRMHRYSIDYAHELLAQFLQLPAADASKGGGYAERK